MTVVRADGIASPGLVRNSGLQRQVAHPHRALVPLQMAVVGVHQRRTRLSARSRAMLTGAAALDAYLGGPTRRGAE